MNNRKNRRKRGMPVQAMNTLQQIPILEMIELSTSIYDSQKLSWIS